MDATIVKTTFHSLILGAEATWTGTGNVGVATGAQVAIPVADDPFTGNIAVACKMELTGEIVWELAGGSTGEMAEELGWESTKASGMVNVTTDCPFTPHPLQLCVTMDWGTEGSEGSVGQYVTVVVTGTRCAGLVLHMVV